MSKLIRCVVFATETDYVYHLTLDQIEEKLEVAKQKAIELFNANQDNLRSVRYGCKVYNTNHPDKLEYYAIFVNPTPVSLTEIPINSKFIVPLEIS